MDHIGKREFGLFIAEDENENNKFCGFAVLNVERFALLTKNAHLRAVYIKPGQSKNLWNDGWPILENWAIKHGCESITVIAKRCPSVYYEKKLKPLGFVPDSITFIKPLEV